MAEEEEGKALPWPKGAEKVENPSQVKFMMVGNDDQPIMKIELDRLNELVEVNGESMPAIQGGTTAATAVALPAGPTGQNRWFDASWGYWKYNNTVLKNPLGTDGIPEGNDGMLYWNGTTETWSISKMQVLPKQEGVDTVRKDGEGLPKESAIYRNVPSIFEDDFNTESNSEIITETKGRSDSANTAVTSTINGNTIIYNTVCEASEDSEVTNVKVSTNAVGTMRLGIVEHDWISAENNPYALIADLGTFATVDGINSCDFTDKSILKGQKVAIISLTNTQVERGSTGYISDNYYIVARNTNANNQVKNAGGIGMEVTFERVVVSGGSTKPLLDQHYVKKEDQVVVGGGMEEGNIKVLSGDKAFNTLPNAFLGQLNKEYPDTTDSVGRADAGSANAGVPSAYFFYNTVATAKEDGKVTAINVYVQSGTKVKVLIANHDWESAENNPFYVVKDLGEFNVTAGQVNTLAINADVLKGQRVGFTSGDAMLRRGGSASYIPNNTWITARGSSSTDQGKNSAGLAYSVNFEYKGVNEFAQELDTRFNPKLNEVDTYRSTGFKMSYFGNVNFPSLMTDSDTFIKVEEFGQSLSRAGETNFARTTVPINGNYMIGSSVQDYAGTGLNPLVNIGEEDLIVPCVNSFSELVRRYVNPKAQFLVRSSGSGGLCIQELRKGTAGYAKFAQNLATTKSTVDALSKKVVCPVIVYVQGESDYTTSKPLAAINQGATEREHIEFYKAQLVALKNEMQADIMEAYGQTKKPLFLVHNPQGSWAGTKSKFVNMAQIECCNENEDMVLLGSPYFTPQYDQGHLSTNGYRWWGEMISKYMFNAFLKFKKSEPLSAKKFTIKGSKIYVDCLVPNPPMKFDTWTVREVKYKGFKVYVEDNETQISDVKIEGNTIVINTSADLDNATKVQLNYGTNENENRQMSEGNICDSDKWVSMYNYEDDSTEISPGDNIIPYRPLDENGNNIFGKKYPMQNWLNVFSEIIKG